MNKEQARKFYEVVDRLSKLDASTLSEQQLAERDSMIAELQEKVKQRLDPKCWDGYKKQGTKIKGGVRVNNCVPESVEQGVAEGLPQTLRKVVPGHAKREIDKKMDAGKFGKTDADKDANFHRYKKIQDKLKEQGVAEGYTVTPGIDRERYQARDGLEGPFSTKSGKVVYYDKVEGKYYDPDTDMYIEYADWQAMNEDAEYNDEAGMAESNLRTMARAVSGLLDTIEDNDNLPEWAQEKIAKAEMMVTSVWDYLLSQKEQGIDPKVEGMAEGSLNEFAPDGFNGGGGDDDEGFSPEIAKMAQDDGFTKGAGLADGATLERAMAINHWHSTHGGMYKQYFAKGFNAGRKEKIRHDNKQYNLNLKLMKDGSIRHGEQGVAEAKKPSPKLTPVNIKKTDPMSEEINTEAYERLQKVFAFKNYES